MERAIEKMKIAKLSSKGQLVIPQDMRQKMKIKEGSLIALASYGSMVVLKKVEKVVSEKDLQSLKLVDEAWNDIASGRYRKLSKKDFLKELAQW